MVIRFACRRNWDTILSFMLQQYTTYVGRPPAEDNLVWCYS